MSTPLTLTAAEALARLTHGNDIYRAESANLIGDISAARRQETTECGQRPFAVIVACSDSRVIPEVIFNAGIGDLFVIRVAGNVLDPHQLGSIEYAVDHLGCALVVILGHEHCGAIDAALHGEPDGNIKWITDDILEAVGNERDPHRACILNVLHVAGKTRQSDLIQSWMMRGGEIRSAIYDIESGAVSWV